MAKITIHDVQQVAHLISEKNIAAMVAAKVAAIAHGYAFVCDGEILDPSQVHGETARERLRRIADTN